MKAIIFDFDGVIHDTFDFHMARIPKFAGIELSEQLYKDMHNGNFYTDAPDEIKQVDWTGYGDYQFQEFRKLSVQEDVRIAIVQLEQSYDLFINSSNMVRNIEHYLENNQLSHAFIDVLGKETTNSKVEKFKMIFNNYDLSADDCIFVTDTLGDILEANKVGVRTIAVDFGFHERERLEKGNPFKIVSSFDEVVSAVEEAA